MEKCIMIPELIKEKIGYLHDDITCLSNMMQLPDCTFAERVEARGRIQADREEIEHLKSILNKGWKKEDNI